jgi:LPS export ABC transporter protein LptC
MRHLSTLFLACFLAVLAGLSGVVAWKVMGRRAPAAMTEPSPEAEYQIKEVHINETLDGSLRWSLDADQAEVYDQRGVTVMRNVVVKVFSKDGGWTVTGDEGTLDNDRRDVSIQGNVVVRSSDGLEVRSPTLAWQNESRTLHTKDPVEIRRAGTTITGQGLSVRMQDERAVLARNVKVVITDRTKSNLALFPRSNP